MIFLSSGIRCWRSPRAGCLRHRGTWRSSAAPGVPGTCRLGWVTATAPTGWHLVASRDICRDQEDPVCCLGSSSSSSSGRSSVVTQPPPPSPSSSPSSSSSPPPSPSSCSHPARSPQEPVVGLCRRLSEDPALLLVSPSSTNVTVTPRALWGSLGLSVGLSVGRALRCASVSCHSLPPRHHVTPLTHPGGPRGAPGCPRVTLGGRGAPGWS